MNKKFLLVFVAVLTFLIILFPTTVVSVSSNNLEKDENSSNGLNNKSEIILTIWDLPKLYFVKHFEKDSNFKATLSDIIDLIESKKVARFSDLSEIASNNGIYIYSGSFCFRAKDFDANNDMYFFKFGIRNFFISAKWHCGEPKYIKEASYGPGFYEDKELDMTVYWRNTPHTGRCFFAIGESEIQDNWYGVPFFIKIDATASIILIKKS